MITLDTHIISRFIRILIRIQGLLSWIQIQSSKARTESRFGIKRKEEDSDLGSNPDLNFEC